MTEIPVQDIQEITDWKEMKIKQQSENKYKI